MTLLTRPRSLVRISAVPSTRIPTFTLATPFTTASNAAVPRKFPSPSPSPLFYCTGSTRRYISSFAAQTRIPTRRVVVAHTLPTSTRRFTSITGMQRAGTFTGVDGRGQSLVLAASSALRRGGSVGLGRGQRRGMKV